MKLFKKKSNQNDDFLAQEAKEEAATAADYTLDIPDDEIWSYQIEGLQAPAINKSYKKATGKTGIIRLTNEVIGPVNQPKTPAKFSSLSPERYI